MTIFISPNGFSKDEPSESALAACLATAVELAIHSASRHGAWLVPAPKQEGEWLQPEQVAVHGEAASSLTFEGDVVSERVTGTIYVEAGEPDGPRGREFLMNEHHPLDGLPDYVQARRSEWEPGPN